MKKPRFTLTELLVAITIVASLACLALPIFTKMGEKNGATQEASNLRQLGIATLAYLADHNDRIFSSATPGGWPSVLYSKYVTDWKTFKSPFDKRPDGAASPTGAGVPVSYGINVNILTQSASGGNAFDGNVAKYTTPSQLIYMAPNVDLTQSLLVFIPGTGDSNVTLNPPTKAPETSRDNRGTHARRGLLTVLFADDHVANIGYRDFATTSSADGSAQARWQPIHTR
jgi:prepilin-type N-terminal cleavage/methylation domain-containing protein